MRQAFYGGADCHYCRKEQAKIYQCIADLNRGYKRDLKGYEDRRREYREKVEKESGN